MTPPLILFVGEPMIELAVPQAQDTARLGVAGDVLNAAIYMRRALRGAARVELVTALGRDRFSDRIMSFAEAHGVGVARTGSDRIASVIAERNTWLAPSSAEKSGAASGPNICRAAEAFRQ